MEAIGDKRYPVGLGWYPQPSDSRDYRLSARKDLIEKLFRRAGARGQNALKIIFDPREPMPPKMVPPAKGSNKRDQPSLDYKYDLKGWPVEDQGTLCSCTAHAVVGLVEFMVQKELAQYVDLSRLFLYNATRRLLGWPGDSGAYIRSTIQAMSTFGVPPEKYWPYDVDYFDAPPDAFLYSFAANFKSMTYFRLDSPSSTGDQTLDLLKRTLAAGFPVAFGFPIYDNIEDTSAKIDFPANRNLIIGGHAVLAVGYDDNYIRFRNSWGRRWGENGYGWLHNDYFKKGYASDLWTVFKQSWIDQEPFN